jgi:hypothetical protein
MIDWQAALSHLEPTEERSIGPDRDVYKVEGV